MKSWRKEKGNLPKNPTSVDMILDQMTTPAVQDNFSINDEQFVHFVESSSERAGKSIALYSKSCIEELTNYGNSENSLKRVAGYCDATFRFFPSIFMQLLIIHFNVKNHVRQDNVKFHFA
jgi:hypothetical protein